jgi:signal transduction histidine kinase
MIKKKKEAVVISVRDAGIGIDKIHQQKIFERFYQVGMSHENTLSGLGMGLYIAHQIAVLHDGKLTVESEKGKGSTFSLTLPLTV